MDKRISTLLDEVRRARMDAFRTRRALLSSTDAVVVDRLSAFADALDRKAETLGKRAARLLALEHSLKLH
jgi:hypothetical protein